MISCKKENLKNLILDMANRLHSDVALTYAHWVGMFPTARSFSLPRDTTLDLRDTKQLGLQLSRTSVFLPFHQLLPAPGAAPCRHNALPLVPGLLCTISFSLLSSEHDQLYGLFPDLPLSLLSCLSCYLTL